MRHSRIAILVLLLTAVLGGVWVATGQEGRVPWPPPPVKFDPTQAGAPTVPPPVPASGTMPPAVRTRGAAVAPGLQQTGYQERPSDIPPPVPAKPTLIDAMPPAGDPAPKPAVPAVMPNLPGGTSASLPIVALPAMGNTQAAPPAQAMPTADPPAIDPTRSVITDPVQQLPVSVKSDRPPAFVLIDPQQEKIATPTPVTPVAPVTPSADPQPPLSASQATQQTVARSVSAPDSSRLADAQTPPVMVEKRSMGPARPGEPRPYQLVVRNLGIVAAAQVTVEDDLPADARVVQAAPMPLLQPGRAAWILNDVVPGSVRIVNFTLEGGPSEWSHRTHVHVSSTQAAVVPSEPTRPQPPAVAPSVAVQVTAPPSAMTGRPAVFEITFANPGKVRIKGLLLHAKLSDGLRHPVGQDIEADVGDLAPGASKTVKVTVTAVLPGRQSIQVHMKSPAGAEAAAQAAVEVAAAPTGGLGIQQAPVTRLFTGRTTDLRIEVTNHSDQPLRGVNIVSYVPEGVEFVEASDYGNYQPGGRTVNWLLDPLPAGHTQAVLLRVMANTPGQLTHTALARAVGVPEIKSSGTLSVEAVADLLVDLRGDHAIELGQETVYEVRVGNPGSGPSTNVRLMLEFTPGLTPRKAEGPTTYRVDGQRVIFDTVPHLASQGQILYRVLVAGQTAGEARIRASVISDQVQTPVTREASARVYRD